MSARERDRPMASPTPYRHAVEEPTPWRERVGPRVFIAAMSLTASALGMVTVTPIDCHGNWWSPFDTGLLALALGGSLAVIALYGWIAFRQRGRVARRAMRYAAIAFVLALLLRGATNKAGLRFRLDDSWPQVGGVCAR